VLRWRLLVASIIIVPLVLLLLADYSCNFGIPGIWLWPLPLAFAMLGVAEVLDLLAAKHLRPAGWSVYSGALLVVGASLVPLGEPLGGWLPAADAPLGRLGWPLAALVTSVVLAFIAEMRRYGETSGAMVRVAMGVFTVAYVPLMISFLILLRLYGNNRWGMIAVVSVIFITKMSDTGAYAFGRLCGRHPMAPQLSPKKTIEGGVGGLVTAWASTLLFFYVAFPWIAGPDDRPPSWWACLVYGTVLAAAGAVGDLSESLLKREMEQKDSSRWMPGLGGILDVLDSLLFAAPAGYFCWASGLLGP
jgi:phosphatidate cytidylyltransferase